MKASVVMYRMLLVVLGLQLTTLPALASEGSGERKPFVIRALKTVQQIIDTMAVKGVDTTYIGRPHRPWSVELRTDVNHATLRMEATMELEDVEPVFWEASTHNGYAPSVGAWVGYRGYGIGLSRALKRDGSSFSLGAVGGSFGMNLRIKSYSSYQPTLRVYGHDDEGKYDEKIPWDIDDPINVKSTFIDAYYLFNGHRFSYAAAYDQSLIQRRSAGSLMVGAMYNHSKVTYDSDTNFLLLAMMNDVGKIDFTQFSVGAGYAYNWVPARNWLVNVMLMPMVTLYNRMTVYYYGYDIDGMQGNDDLLDDDVSVYLTSKERTKNQLSWNYDARLCVGYNWERCYMRVYGHYNSFRYKNDAGKGRLTDWTAYAALGFRF